MPLDPRHCFSDGAGIIQTDTAPYVEAYFASAEAPGGGRYIANEVGAGIAQPGKFTFGAIQAGAYFTLADAAYPLYTNLSYGIAHGFGQDLSLNLLSEGAFVLDFRYISGPISLTATVYTSNGPWPGRQRCGLRLAGERLARPNGGAALRVLHQRRQQPRARELGRH